MKIKKIAYWISTILLCFVFLYSAGMYLLKPEMVAGFFEALNYPTYLIYPLAIAKILGVIMVLWRRSTWLTEWAYAGLFFDVLLAFFAHHQAGHDISQTLLTIVLILVSYFLGKIVRFN